MSCGQCRFYCHGRCWHPHALSPKEPIAGGRLMHENSAACYLWDAKKGGEA